MSALIAPESPTSFSALYKYLSGARKCGSRALECVRDGNAEGAWGSSLSAAHFANLWYAEIETLCACPSFADEDEDPELTDCG